MKGYTPQRTRNVSDCEPLRSPRHLDPLYPPSTSSTLSHTPFLLPAAMDHYGALDPHHFSPSPSPGGLPPDCLMPLNNQLSSSSTFPRIHYNSHFDQGDFSHTADSIGGINSGTLGTSMSMGMGLGVGRTAMITSGSATISGAGKMNRLPPNLLDQFEKQVPGQQDGFSTLQFHRSTAVTTTKQQQQQRTDSPGKIRYLVHSVQKLFAKSQSLENSAIRGNMNGRNSRSSSSDDKHHRSKSKDRAKNEGTAKRRPRSNMSGYWSSDDLDSDISNYRNPKAMMTLGRQAVGSGPGPGGQVASRYFMQGYSTMGEHMLKSSKSNSDVKHQGLPALQGPGGSRGGVGGGQGPMFDGNFGKGGPWSTLTLGPTRQLCHKGSATLDRTLLKSKSVQQDMGCHFLQVHGRMPSTSDWTGTLGRSGPMGEIPCRRMRSGSYVKAMGDPEDSDDSDGSLKPSPKSTARRQSYLRATQQSLSDQFPSRNCLPSLREFSGNRSLDNLDCIGGSSPFPNWDDDDFSQGCSTLGRGSCISQVRDMELSHHYGDELEDMHPRSRCSDLPDMPMPTCFRSRSHSYLRAIQAGCSQDEDSASVDSDSPPPTTTTTVRTYSNSTVSTCMTSCKRVAPPPVPPRTTSKPFISVTVQSSTESAQDSYPDHLDRKNEVNSQSGRSNSSDSLDSLPKGSRPPVAPPREPQIPAAVVISSNPLRESHHEQVKGEALSADERPVDPVPRRKLSSIGIQVDCIQELQAKVETPPLARFQSIGVQVEDGWTFSRSSSMASRQETDSDTQDLSLTSLTFPSNSKHTEKKVMVNSASQSVDLPPQLSLNNGNHDNEVAVTTSGPSRQILTNRSTTQSSSSSFSESLDPALDPSSLPPPDPWLESGNGTGSGGPAQPLTGATACRRDGHWFLKLLQAETGRMEGWCSQMEKETSEHQLSEEVLGKVRSAVGCAQLLMSQKFQQFRGLCEQNLNVNANPRPTAQDLAGFWDLLQLSIEDISLKFDELYHLKSNEWKLEGDSPEKQPRDVQENQKQAPPVPKKPVKSKASLGREKSNDTVDKQRQEARKRLMAAKRAQSVKQNSTTESTDSIEIYVPEAQTRL
ncbi:disks large-associated protein 4-like isoform X3 [Carassius carassius]|uniref:disks large-associated protein 4-like isoform X3 n=1 Tax=Carassius carassius TaxID=217509 RepID=UPI002868AB01|nr:disks large-associated protein 4-like isoform X3 [Carassius carassius]